MKNNFLVTGFLCVGFLLGQPTSPSLALTASETELTQQLAALKQSLGPEEPSGPFLRVLSSGLGAYENTRDYECLFTKKERQDNKQMGPTERVFIKFEKPFKIFMGWLSTAKEGLQVVYQRGKHDNQLAVHQPGLLFGLAQVVFLDQNSPWVKEGSASYNIEDAGIGNFLYEMTEAVNDALKKHKLVTRPVSANVPRSGKTFEIVFEDSKPDEIYFAKRLVVTFDGQSRLPVRMRLYDWDGQVTGVYAYQNLRLNAGPTSAAFEKTINRRLKRVYAN